MCIKRANPGYAPVVSNTGSTGKTSALLRVVGWFCLALGAAASAILIGDRLFDIAPPGCGPESACAKLARGPWSVVHRGSPLSLVERTAEIIQYHQARNRVASNPCINFWILL